MKKDQEKNNTPSSQPGEKDDNTYYPPYPADEDIYSQYKEEDLDPENKKKKQNKAPGKLNEKDFGEDQTGSDLDVPGSELDDELEDIGSEDEENNYYSLGGDDHDDLDEDTGG